MFVYIYICYQITTSAIPARLHCPEQGAALQWRRVSTRCGRHRATRFVCCGCAHKRVVRARCSFTVEESEYTLRSPPHYTLWVLRMRPQRVVILLHLELHPAPRGAARRRCSCVVAWACIGHDRVAAHKHRTRPRYTLCLRGRAHRVCEVNRYTALGKRFFW